MSLLRGDSRDAMMLSFLSLTVEHAYFQGLAVLAILGIIVILWGLYRNWRRSILLPAIAILATSVCLMLAGAVRKTALFEAIESRNIVDIKMVLDDKPDLIRAKTFSGKTALHLAVESGSNEIVVVLIGAGASVNAKDSSNVTPLHMAAFLGYASIAETLLKAGADVNARGFRHNETPLHVAALHGHSSVVNIILLNGGDLHALNMLKKTPLQLAQENQKSNVVKILLKQ